MFELYKKGLTLRTTSKCNHNCIFCTQKDFLNKYDYANFLKFDISLLNNILTILEKDKYDFIIISWWESTLNRDIVKLVNFFCEKGVHVFLMTNGSNLHNISLDTLNKLTTIYVSYHSFQDNYELLIWTQKIREIDNTQESQFEIVSRNIELLLSKWFSVIIKIVVNKYNISSLELFVEYIFSRFWQNIKIEVTLMEGLERKEVRDIACDIRDYNNLIKKLYVLYTWKVFFEWWKICDDDLFASHYQEIFSLIPTKILWEIKIDDTNQVIYTKKQSLVWRGNIKKYLKKCSSCHAFNDCHWYDIFYLKK